jgi:hypothetical protein
MRYPITILAARVSPGVRSHGRRPAVSPREPLMDCEGGSAWQLQRDVAGKRREAARFGEDDEWVVDGS